MQAPYASVSPTRISPSEEQPQVDNVSIVKGDQKDLKYLFKNVVYTETRPTDGEDLPMYSADEITAETHIEDLGADPVEGTDYSETRLVADWNQRYWHSEIRSNYISTYRMYNGWVPWYGRRPQWSWWSAASLIGTFVVNPSYSTTEEGTVVHLILPSMSSAKIYPGDNYSWDLESGIPVWNEGLDPDTDDPSAFTALKTWIGGKVTVLQDWTQGTPIA